MKGSATGTQATQTVQSVLSQAQTMLRDGRSSGVRAAQAMLAGYAAMVNGVLIGMSEGLKAGGSKAAAAPAAAPASAAKAAAKPRSARRR
jgi:ribosomal protein L12E/L44/L45/RPP1/RPP2